MEHARWRLAGWWIACALLLVACGDARGAPTALPVPTGLEMATAVAAASPSPAPTAPPTSEATATPTFSPTEQPDQLFSPLPTPAPTWTPTPTMTAQELEEEVEARAPDPLQQVLTEYSTASAAALLAALHEIAPSPPIEEKDAVLMPATPVPGSEESGMPALLVSWRQPCPPCAPGRETLLIWRDPDLNLWRSQMLSYEAIDFIAQDRARIARSDGEVYLALVRNPCAASTMGYCEFLFLYRLADGGWREVWPGQTASGWNHSLAQIDFSGDGIDVAIVRNSDFQSEDPKSRLFRQNHGSVHRWFDETWRRDGDRYVLVERQVESSPYNTLVEFIYALQTGGDAAQWIAAPEALREAEQLGLAVVDYFIAGCPTWEEPLCQEEGPLQLMVAGETVTVTFTQQNDRILIEALQAHP